MLADPATRNRGIALQRALFDSVDEVGRVLGIPTGTVKSRLSRGRAKLRDFLWEKGELLPTRYRLRGDAEA